MRTTLIQSLQSIMAAILLMVSIPVFADSSSQTNQTDDTYTMYMASQAKECSEPDPELEETGYRAPSRRVLCVISPEGLSINTNGEEIVSYELRDPETDACLGIYTDDTNFISHLYTVKADYKIVLTTDSYHYIGYLSVE